MTPGEISGRQRLFSAERNGEEDETIELAGADSNFFSSESQQQRSKDGDFSVFD